MKLRAAFVSLALVLAAQAAFGASKAKSSAHSIGAPNKGKLEGASLLKGSKTLRNRKGSHSWGTPDLVHALKHASVAVDHKFHGSQLLVGDLSGKTGGFLEKHNSHQSGRDADVGFYVTNSKGKAIPSKRFIPFDGNGKARDVDNVLFDDARNWTFVEALLKDDKANVRFVFVSNPLRARLLAYATKHKVVKELVEKAAGAMMSPEDADVHDDHFHIRIKCPGSGKEGCIEEAVSRMPYDPSKPAKDGDGAADAPSAKGDVADDDDKKEGSIN